MSERSVQVSGSAEDAAPGVRSVVLWVLGAVALVGVVGSPAAASWHGLVGFGRGELGLSDGWEYLVPVSLDGAALYAAVLAVRAVLACDSAIWPRVLTCVYALAAAGFNMHAAPTAVAALFFGGMSLSAVVLWDTTLRALRRDQLRELGAVQGVAARFRPLRWLLAPGETASAWRTAVVEDVTDPRQALRMARGQAERLDRETRPVDAPTPSPRAEVPTTAPAGLPMGKDAAVWLFDEAASFVAGAHTSGKAPASGECAIEGDEDQVDEPARADVDEQEHERAVAVELDAAETKASALRIAWRELGVQGLPATTDVMPAVAWLADRGVRVDRSRAYDVRRKVAASATATAARPGQLALVGGERR